MALTYDGMPCSLCGKPIADVSKDVFALTMWGIEDPRFAHLDDGACHQACINNWNQRDAFIEYYNRKLKHELYVDSNGRVAYKFDYFTWVLGGIAMFIGVALCGPPLALLEIRWKSVYIRTLVFFCPYAILLAVFVGCAYITTITTAAWVSGMLWVSSTALSLVACVWLNATIKESPRRVP